MAKYKYISASCRNSVSSLDVISTSKFYKNTLAFASCNALAIANTHDEGSAKITHTFVHHNDRINVVRWIKTHAEENPMIITGSNDKTAIIWSCVDEVLAPLYYLKGHIGSVTFVDGLAVQCNNETFLYAVTASIDSTIKIWKKKSSDKGEIQETQVINLGRGICLCAKISTLPKSQAPILAVCLDDGKIHIYVETIDNFYNSKFVKVETLLGHEDWVRDVDFVEIDDRLLIATCSQDTYVRIWSITCFQENVENSSDEIIIEKKVFTAWNKRWNISLEAVLSGHEGWVYGVHWHYNPENEQLKLLSSSFDKSLIIWEASVDNGMEGMWTEKVRVGEVGGGGLGFYGGRFTPDGNSIIGHSYTGSFHIWNYNKETDCWKPSVTFGGHYKEIVDLDWEPNGEFIYTASTDQTTRVHCPWKRSDRPENITWHELARPQIHGYDMSCLAVISRYQFVSGAEEKIVRAFSAPHNFIANFKNISGRDDVGQQIHNLPEGASVPSLGLSNKAVFSTETPSVKTHVKDQYPENYFVSLDIKEPPTEEMLMQNTLWPETNKLYGHGYEVFALAASKDGKLVASSCKSTNAQHAAILTWNTSTWLQIQNLQSHQLTVTQLAFSPDNLYLLSVSRDRRWSIFKRESLDDLNMTLICSSNKQNGIHTRIIWCCAWTPDSDHFITGSREGKVVIWSKDSDIFINKIPPLELSSESVTALAVADKKYFDSYIIAAGFESGKINIFSCQIQNSFQPWNLVLQMDKSFAHHLTVRRLSFRPSFSSSPDDNTLELASGSNDGMLKVYSINIAELHKV